MWPRLIIFCFCIQQISLSYHAEFHDPVYGGPGCPKNQTAAVLSPDHSALSIVFESFEVEAGAGTDRYFTRKNCNLRVPVTILGPVKMRIAGADFRGLNHLPCFSSMTLSTWYALEGHDPEESEKIFFGPLSAASFLVRHRLATRAGDWSVCGKDTKIHIDSSLNIWSISDSDRAFSSVHSLDMAIDIADQHGITIYLEWEKC